MSNTTTEQGQPQYSKGSVSYSQWGDERADRHHSARKADEQAAFFIPYLECGMKVLDCGCGPGTITTGLAAVVFPGHVVGIDLDESALETARHLAVENQIRNVEFESGNINSLPYQDAEFDAAYSHAVFEHLSDPSQALKEIYRVLTNGGILGIRIPDMDGWLISPDDPVLEDTIREVEKYRAQHGADMRRGKHMRRYLRESGFTEIEMGASYDVHGTPESVQAFVDTWFPESYQPAHDPIVRSGVMDERTAGEMAIIWRTWAGNPDSFLARSFCEVVGRKR